jgi:FtsP/CotA-like multicopper oxidase with cupredoxin domain
MRSPTWLDLHVQLHRKSPLYGSVVSHALTLGQVSQPGTYWYHSHTRGQYPDGLRGPLIIHDPDFPYLGQYDEELILSVSDWYHDQMTDLLPGFIRLVLKVSPPLPCSFSPPACEHDLRLGLWVLTYYLFALGASHKDWAQVTNPVSAAREIRQGLSLCLTMLSSTKHRISTWLSNQARPTSSVWSTLVLLPANTFGSRVTI